MEALLGILVIFLMGAVVMGLVVTWGDYKTRKEYLPRIVHILVADLRVPEGKVKPRTKLAELGIDQDRLLTCLAKEV